MNQMMSLEPETPSVGTTVGLPGSAYGSASFDWECRDLFPGTWSAVALASRIPEAGDLLPVKLGDWSFFFARQANGAVRAFHNVCRHRGIKLVAEPCSKRKRLICPWHAWTYGIDGHLLKTPRLGGLDQHDDPAFDKQLLGLVEIPVGHYLDFLFVNLDGKAPPFKQHIAPLKAFLAGINVDSAQNVGQWDHRYPGNWKLSVEGGVEDYHLWVAHPQVTGGLTDYRVRIDAEDGVFFCTSAESQRVGENSDAHLPTFTFDRAEDQGRKFIVGVFPFGNIAIDDTSVIQGLMLPDGHDGTRLEFGLYLPPATMAEEFASDRARLLDEWKVVLQQDTHLVAAAQAGLAARDLAGIPTRFATNWEGAVVAFESMIYTRARAAGVAWAETFDPGGFPH